jgi:hypothetical protein
MGSMIYLTIGNLELDWGKNFGFADHSCLFRRSDIKPIAYRYVAEDHSPVVEMKEGYSSPLRQVLRRLSLLGYSDEAAESEYERLLAEHLLSTDETKDRYLSFKQFASAIASVDVTAVSADYDSDYDHGEFFSKEMFDRLRLDSLLGDGRDKRAISRFLETFDPYWTLTLLSNNPANLDVAVEWGYADVAENWTGRDIFIHELETTSKFLVVTEGSSDASIIRKALDILTPEIADFFTFVDMEEGYPFTGTGNLHRFCQGLVSIGIQNKVIVIYDNDLEGSARFSDTKALRLPKNMRVMKLPDHVSFDQFNTEGPNGNGVDNINGRAASIECYLDLNWKNSDDPRVQWTSYNRALAAYHGELINKEGYARRFLGLRRREENYDYSKLLVVLDAIARECSGIAAHGTDPFFSEYL